MVAGLIVIFLIGAPGLVSAVGHWVDVAGITQRRSEAGWRQVPATMQRGAAEQPGDSSGPPGTVEMLARWTAPDGRVRRGWIPVSPETEAGSSTRVWVSRAGALTGQPLRPAQLGGRVAIAGLMTAYVLALLLGLAGSAGRSILYRCRLAGWETDWHGVRPRWTRQG